jgi:hypothetical protein
VAPEPEGSSTRSQQPANGPYPEPAESTPLHLFKGHFCMEIKTLTPEWEWESLKCNSQEKNQRNTFGCPVKETKTY